MCQHLQSKSALGASIQNVESLNPGTMKNEFQTKLWAKNNINVKADEIIFTEDEPRLFCGFL